MRITQTRSKSEMTAKTAKYHALKPLQLKEMMENRPQRSLNVFRNVRPISAKWLTAMELPAFMSLHKVCHAA